MGWVRINTLGYRNCRLPVIASFCCTVARALGQNWTRGFFSFDQNSRTDRGPTDGIPGAKGLSKMLQMEKTNRVGDNGIIDYLPEPCVKVLAHTQRYSCQAFLDEKKIWRSAFTGEPITARVLSWEPV